MFIAHYMIKVMKKILISVDECIKNLKYLSGLEKDAEMGGSTQNLFNYGRFKSSEQISSL